MQGEGWQERLGRVIGGTFTFGIMGALAGLVWSLALGFSMSTGALGGGIVGAGIVFILTLGLSSYAAKGMAAMFGGLWGGVLVIGLVVWLVRSLIGCS